MGREDGSVPEEPMRNANTRNPVATLIAGQPRADFELHDRWSGDGTCAWKFGGPKP